MAATQSLVVATDLSARSDRAVDRALMLGEAWGARVRVVHVLRRRGRQPDLDALAQAARATLPDPEADVDILLPTGPAPARIAQAGADAALIVTGVARFNDIGHFLLGTLVDHVIRAAVAPVLVVRQRPHDPYRKLLVASDFSDCSRDALLAADRLFPQAAIRLYHAYGLPDAGARDKAAWAALHATAQQEADAFLADPAIPERLRARIDVELDQDFIELAIDDALARYQPDLVVLGTHGMGVFERALVGSTAEQLLTRLPVDTMVVPEMGA